jgi:small subunit ribosomal protein S15
LRPELPEDLGNLIRSAVKELKHLQNNKADITGKRGYQLTVSKIRRLAIYYKNRGLLPMDWKYSDEKAVLLVR